MTQLTLKRAAFTLAALALPLAAAQAMKPLGFALSKDPGMNMMMMHETIDISAYPGAKLLSSKVSGTSATLVYMGNDAKSIFAFYDKAILGEGWKHSGAMMNGASMSGGSMAGDHMMAGSSMAGGSMAGDHAMAGNSMAGDHMMADDKMMTAAEYGMQGHAMTLGVTAKAGRVTVAFNSAK